MSLSANGWNAGWEANLASLEPKNLNILKVWLSVGSDVRNGIWTVMGARVGLTRYWKGLLRLEQISDYDYLRALWSAEYSAWGEREAFAEACRLGTDLKEMGLECPLLDAQASAWFKSVYRLPNFKTYFDPSKKSPITHD